MMTMDTTSTGMSPIAAAHDALDIPPMQAPTVGRSPPTVPATVTHATQSLLGEGKAQLSSGLGGIAEAVRDIAAKLEGNGAAPLAHFVHDAADTVHGWARTVEHKSVDDLLGETRSLVRTSPALAVGLAVVAGFAVVRIVRAGR